MANGQWPMAEWPMAEWPMAEWPMAKWPMAKNRRPFGHRPSTIWSLAIWPSAIGHRPSAVCKPSARVVGGRGRRQGGAGRDGDAGVAEAGLQGGEQEGDVGQAATVAHQADPPRLALEDAEAAADLD